ncbi:putative transporter subunit: membrane component of ABC superfamily [Rhodospirillaceae bacterium LM-1]|nr:putative transporter subunit: membrane component of ABC superfamily [Rhodospirillaceae bacterium LM-1]
MSPNIHPAMGPVNWLGLWTLLSKEVRRFLKVYFQTIFAPVVTTLLFLAVFALALGRKVEMVAGVHLLEFLAPGLIMMTMVQNAFANSSSSLIMAKVQGNIIDVLMPPLSAGELVVGFAGGGMIRGLLVGMVVAVTMAFFVPMAAPHPFFIVYHAVAASLMLSLLGMMGGIWADKFDHMAAVTNFIVTPLSFLSGTFYTIDRLPEVFHALALINPFFYMIDGFRYGMIGHADGNLLTGALYIGLVDVALLILSWMMFKRGYKLKA